MHLNKSDFIKAKIHCHLTPGEMLKTLRELQGMTQATLAKKTGIPQSNLSALENNTRQIGRERCLVLANALRVHPSVLLFPDFDMRKIA